MDLLHYFWIVLPEKLQTDPEPPALRIDTMIALFQDWDTLGRQIMLYSGGMIDTLLPGHQWIPLSSFLRWSHYWVKHMWFFYERK